MWLNVGLVIGFVVLLVFVQRIASALEAQRKLIEELKAGLAHLMRKAEKKIDLPDTSAKVMEKPVEKMEPVPPPVAAPPPLPRAEVAPKPPQEFKPDAVDVFLTTAWQRVKQYVMKEGNFWVLAGIVVLLFGAVFLIRYTMTRGWFTPAMRLTGVAVLGLALLGFGITLRERRRIYALLLQGCGLSMMYLSTVGAAL